MDHAKRLRRQRGQDERTVMLERVKYAEIRDDDAQQQSAASEREYGPQRCLSLLRGGC